MLIVSRLKQWLRGHRLIFALAHAVFRVVRGVVVDINLALNRVALSRTEKELAGLKRRLDVAGRPKILFVKQEVLALLYCCGEEAGARDLIFSSLKHTGPVGLFTRLGASACIVKTEADAPECETWREVALSSQTSAIDELESLRHRPFKGGARGHRHAPGEFSVSCDAVDWAKFDIVFSMDISVPSRIVGNTPSVAWAYCISEPGLFPAYEDSHVSPVAGYDLFLNQMFRRNPGALKWHEIEFPLNLQYYGCFHDLCGVPLDASETRKGIFIESHTAATLSEDQKARLAEFGPFYLVSPGTEDIIRDLMLAKYFIRLGGRYLRGNGMVEAVAAGCLVLGDAHEFMNYDLFLPEHHVSSFAGLLRRIRALEADDAQYRESVRRQRALLDCYCFYRPAVELIEKAGQLRGLKSESRPSQIDGQSTKVN